MKGPAGSGDFEAQPIERTARSTNEGMPLRPVAVERSLQSTDQNGAPLAAVMERGIQDLSSSSK